MNDTVKKVMKYSYLAGSGIAAALLFRQEVAWASGLMVGVIWSVANYSLTINLFEVALLQKDPKRLTRALMIKFPVLYLAGFFLLKCRFFSPMGILAGVGIALFVIGMVNLWQKRIQ